VSCLVNNEYRFVDDGITADAVTNTRHGGSSSASGLRTDDVEIVRLTQA